MILKPQMIPEPELFPTQKVRNGMDSMKSLTMDGKVPQA